MAQGVRGVCKCEGLGRWTVGGVEIGVDVFGSSRKWAESFVCWGFSLSSEGRGAVGASIGKSSLGVKGLIIGLLVTFPSLQVNGLFVLGMG